MRILHNRNLFLSHRTWCSTSHFHQNTAKQSISGTSTCSSTSFSHLVCRKQPEKGQINKRERTNEISPFLGGRLRTMECPESLSIFTARSSHLGQIIRALCFLSSWNIHDVCFLLDLGLFFGARKITCHSFSYQYHPIVRGRLVIGRYI